MLSPMALPDHMAPLLQATAYPHACSAIALVETHISWVILTGDFAYKLKKPVRYPFVDFSTLERRAHFCREELRCNRVFAPSLYLDVVPVVRAEDGQIRMSGPGEVLEWAVQMRQFPGEAQLDRLLQRGGVEPAMLVEFGRSLAARHQALPGRAFAAAELQARLLQPLQDNFTEVLALPWAAAHEALLTQARSGTDAHIEAHRALLVRRLEEGWIRECHGDLHLSNLVVLDSRVTAFDCLEFNPDLRWIDPQSDVAFLFMDCLVRERSDLAYAFVDGYLEESGDYQGAVLLSLYAGYRSMVRAKVAALRREQAVGGEVLDCERRFLAHVRWTADWLNRPPGRLILMCGLSGSGKSFLAQRLVPLLPAVRLRSDVARKVLAGLTPLDHRPAAVGAGLYQAQRSQTVYDQLLELAGQLLQCGEHVIVDATFLTEERRRPFIALAAALGTRALVLVCQAPLEVLRQRVQARGAEGADPSDADLVVLQHQLDEFEPPSAAAVSFDTGSVPAALRLRDLCRLLLDPD
jgi:uncharacterized protein